MAGGICSQDAGYEGAVLVHVVVQEPGDTSDLTIKGISGQAKPTARTAVTRKPQNMPLLLAASFAQRESVNCNLPVSLNPRDGRQSGETAWLYWNSAAASV